MSDLKAPTYKKLSASLKLKTGPNESDLKASTYKKLSASLKLKIGPVLEGPNHLDVRDPRILKNRPMWGKA